MDPYLVIRHIYDAQIGHGTHTTAGTCHAAVTSGTDQDRLLCKCKRCKLLSLLAERKKERVTPIGAKVGVLRHQPQDLPLNACQYTMVMHGVPAQ